MIGFSYNGTHSRTYDIAAKSINRPLLPALRKREFISPTMHGTYDLGDNQFDKKYIEVEIKYIGTSFAELRTRARTIAYWLSGYGNTKVLYFDDEPDKFYNAKIYSDIGLQNFFKVGQAKLIFECDPYAHSSAISTADELYSGNSTIYITSNGTVETAPLIEIEGRILSTFSASFTRASVAYKQDGTQVASGEPRYETGLCGQGIMIANDPALSFNGTTSYIDVDVLAVHNTFTIEFKFIHKGTKGANTGHPAGTCDMWARTGNADRWPLVGIGFYGGNLFVSANNEAGGWNEYKNICAFTSLNHGDKMAFVFDYPNMTVYQNGISLGTFTFTTAGSFNEGAAVKTSIGRAGEYNDYYFDGVLDEIRYWTTARTQPQIQDNMNSWLVGNEAGLLYYWRLNDGSGATATDSGPGAKNGTITGGTWVNLAETLTIPTAGAFTKGSATIEFTFEPTSTQAVAGKYGYLWFCFIDGSNLYYLAVNSSGYLLAYIISGGISYSITDSEALVVGTKYRIGFCMNGTQGKLWKNEAQIGTGFNYTEPVGTLPANMYLGSYYSGIAQPNGIFDEFCISSTARPDADMATRGASTNPLPIDEDTTAKMDCDGNLTIYGAVPGVTGAVETDTENPTITVGTASITYSGVLTYDEKLTIDMDKMQMYIGATNALGGQSGDFLNLEPGENTITYSDDGSNRANVTVTYTDKWI